MEITEELKRAVWKKGVVDDKYPSDKVRKDSCGALIYYEDFGDRDSMFGWEIDHIFPKVELCKKKDISDDQIDNIINLRPLNCKNNASKGANYPFYTACLKADDEHITNIEMREGKVVNLQIQKQLNEFYGLES